MERGTTIQQMLDEFNSKSETVKTHLAELNSKAAALSDNISALTSEYQSLIAKVSMGAEDVNPKDVQDARTALDQVRAEFQDVTEMAEIIEKSKDNELSKMMNEMEKEFEKFADVERNRAQERVPELRENKLAYLSTLYDVRQSMNHVRDVADEIRTARFNAGIRSDSNSYRDPLKVDSPTVDLSPLNSLGEQTTYRILDREIYDIYVSGEIRKYPMVHAFNKYGKVFHNSDDAAKFIKEQEKKERN